MLAFFPRRFEGLTIAGHHLPDIATGDPMLWPVIGEITPRAALRCDTTTSLEGGPSIPFAIRHLPLSRCPGSREFVAAPFRLFVSAVDSNAFAVVPL